MRSGSSELNSKSSIMNSPSSEYTSLSQIKTPGYYWVNVGKFTDNPFDGSSGSALLHVLNYISDSNIGVQLIYLNDNLGAKKRVSFGDGFDKSSWIDI